MLQKVEEEVRTALHKKTLSIQSPSLVGKCPFLMADAPLCTWQQMPATGTKPRQMTSQQHVT